MKGLAHVGAISVLEEHSIEADVVAGCSVGAVIGAFYAKGYTAQEMADILREHSVLSLFTKMHVVKEGLLDRGPFREFLVEHLGDCTFDDLERPLYLSCTDINEGHGVTISEGSVVDAVLASASIPGLFAPVEIDGQSLVDGGISNNLPVSVLMEHDAEFTIGVRLFWQTLSWKESLQAAEEAMEEAEDSSEPWPKFVIATETLAEWLIENMPRSFAVVQRCLDLVVKENEELRLEAYPPDLLITPEVTDIGILEFHENEEILFERGQEAAREHADTLRSINPESSEPKDSAPAADATDEDTEYVGNPEAKTFHRSVCERTEDIADPVSFSSVDEAEAEGYTPCDSCKPEEESITEHPDEQETQDEQEEVQE